ncbi:uncharacterized protein BYT42DRAFT_568940 [Radiomyces spectabilis]|uniref:uncharacterized protein n=1 Tax=Radiomyces spectabilis TaxID=64574 RepID=UPI00221F304C|nr:uncharacterized protein BYT42DRAFT_568940 [Radiomyces spectabilis]KAI8379475.1 hypothetical protein BYT42DRAFT_568940 [Radiomyces spectabilis]
MGSLDLQQQTYPSSTTMEITPSNQSMDVSDQFFQQPLVESQASALFAANYMMPANPVDLHMPPTPIVKSQVGPSTPMSFMQPSMVVSSQAQSPLPPTYPPITDFDPTASFASPMHQVNNPTTEMAWLSQSQQPQQPQQPASATLHQHFHEAEQQQQQQQQPTQSMTGTDQMLLDTTSASSNLMDFNQLPMDYFGTMNTNLSYANIPSMFNHPFQETGHRDRAHDAFKFGYPSGMPFLVQATEPNFTPIPTPVVPSNVRDDNAIPVKDDQRKVRRSLPRRHTVSTPYSAKAKDPIDPATTINPEQPQAKFRKYLKAKRHRSLGRLELPPSPSPHDERRLAETSSPSVCSPLSAELDMLSNEQLLERVVELEQEKQAALAPAMDRKVSSESSINFEETQDDEDEEDKNQCLWEDCMLELNSLDDLIDHVKTAHIGSGKPLYYCGWRDCHRKDKPFSKRHKMHNHLRTHTGERPFACTEEGCSKRFSRPDSLTTHMKIHTNIRPYLCPYENCGKAYYHLRSLRKHERTHDVGTDHSMPPTNVAHTLPAHVVQPSEASLTNEIPPNTHFL